MKHPLPIDDCREMLINLVDAVRPEGAASIPRVGPFSWGRRTLSAAFVVLCNVEPKTSMRSLRDEWGYFTQKHATTVLSQAFFALYRDPADQNHALELVRQACISSTEGMMRKAMAMGYDAEEVEDDGANKKAVRDASQPPGQPSNAGLAGQRTLKQQNTDEELERLEKKERIRVLKIAQQQADSGAAATGLGAAAQLAIAQQRPEIATQSRCDVGVHSAGLGAGATLAIEQQLAEIATHRRGDFGDTGLGAAAPLKIAQQQPGLAEQRRCDFGAAAAGLGAAAPLAIAPQRPETATQRRCDFGNAAAGLGAAPPTPSDTTGVSNSSDQLLAESRRALPASSNAFPKAFMNALPASSNAFPKAFMNALPRGYVNFIGQQQGACPAPVAPTTQIPQTWTCHLPLGGSAAAKQEPASPMGPAPMAPTQIPQARTWQGPDAAMNDAKQALEERLKHGLAGVPAEARVARSEQEVSMAQGGLARELAAAEPMAALLGDSQRRAQELVEQQRRAQELVEQQRQQQVHKLVEQQQAQRQQLLRELESNEEALRLLSMGQEQLQPVSNARAEVAEQTGNREEMEEAGMRANASAEAAKQLATLRQENETYMRQAALVAEEVLRERRIALNSEEAQQESHDNAIKARHEMDEMRHEMAEMQIEAAKFKQLQEETAALKLAEQKQLQEETAALKLAEQQLQEETAAMKLAEAAPTAQDIKEDTDGAPAKKARKEEGVRASD